MLSTCLSDDDMVVCVRKLHAQKFSPNKKMVRSYRCYDINNFCNELRNVNWDNIMDYTCHDADRLCSKFIDAFLTIVNVHAPIRQLRICGLDNPWMNGDIKRIIYQRDLQFKNAKKSHLSTDWIKYKELQNKVSGIIRKAKSDFSRKTIEENRDDPRTFWKTVKKIAPMKSVCQISRYFKICGEIITSAKVIAQAFNLYFVAVVRNLIKSVSYSYEANMSINQFSLRKPAEKFFFAEVSADFVCALLKCYCSEFFDPHFFSLIKSAFLPDLFTTNRIKIGQFKPIL